MQTQENCFEVRGTYFTSSASLWWRISTVL